MGRKIPGKKHKGVKDPEKQHAKRLAELQPKINVPPKNVDDQDIPRSLERVMKLKAAVKSNKFVKKKRKRNQNKGLVNIGAQQVSLHPKAKPEKTVPVFKQKPGENPRAFLFRVGKETEAFIKETAFETKYNVQVQRNVETGRVEGIVKQGKDEIDELMKLKSKHKNVNKKKKVNESEAKLSKSQKKREKILKKREQRLENDLDEFKLFSDKVEFGDVAHAPPELKILRKKESIENTKVGNKNLLLNSLLKPSQSQNNEKSKTINKTGRRKNLPAGERRQIEKQQSEAIAAYRLMKAEKSLSQ